MVVSTGSPEGASVAPAVPNRPDAGLQGPGSVDGPRAQGATGASTVSPPRTGLLQPASNVRDGLSPQDAIARVKASVVLVLAVSDDGISSGSGFVVNAGQVATCAHVLDGARRLIVVTADGQQQDAVPGALDPVQDVALLSCSDPLPPALTLGNSDLVREGD